MVATTTERSPSRQILAVAVGTVVLSAAATLAAGVALGLLVTIAGGTPRPVAGTILLVVAVGATTAATAWWLARSVVPRLAAPAYLRASVQEARPLVELCAVLTGVYFLVITLGEGAMAAGAWFVGATAAGVAGARWATRR